MTPRLTERAGYCPPPRADYVEPDALEGETLAQKLPRFMPAAWPSPQPMWVFGGKYFKPGQWSNDRALLWGSGRAPSKERHELLVPVTVSGKYRVLAQLARGADFGIVQFTLDDAELGAPVDCYAPELQPGAPVELGVVSLSAGEHTLGLGFTGRNPAAPAARTDARLGLDYVKLVPVD
ncbi:MAG: hypothetical protein LBK60_08480 [Verrucomicrobiales bacterium]|nr:hypothetical protein [Verrucomicrobiales bacterium]